MTKLVRHCSRKHDLGGGDAIETQALSHQSRPPPVSMCTHSPGVPRYAVGTKKPPKSPGNRCGRTSTGRLTDRACLTDTSGDLLLGLSIQPQSRSFKRFPLQTMHRTAYDLALQKLDLRWPLLITSPRISKLLEVIKDMGNSEKENTLSAQTP